MVSETYAANQKETQEQDIKGKVIERLRALGAIKGDQFPGDRALIDLRCYL